MSNNTVEQFAAELRRPVADLLKQLQEAGVSKTSGSDSITSDDKKRLLAYLKKSHGSESGTISIGRKKAEVSTVAGVQVETRRRARTVVVPSTDALAAEAKAKAEQEAAEKAAADSKASLAEHGVKGVFTVFGGESSDEEINRQQAEFDQAGCRFVVGIGGGKTLDTAKAVAYYKNVPVVIFPTLASTDAPCTGLTVVYNADGSFNRYLFLPNNPNAVLADTKLLAAEPARFFAAGVGDGLATYFEARTCYASNGINLVLMQPSLAGLGIAKMCYETIRDYAPQAMSAVAAKAVTPALERTIEATIYMSGVGAESGGGACDSQRHDRGARFTRRDARRKSGFRPGCPIGDGRGAV